MKVQQYVLFILLINVIASCSKVDMTPEVASAYDNLPEFIDFNQHVKPILSDKCFSCHGPDENKISAGLQLHTSELAYAKLTNSDGKYAIVPGRPEQSESIHRILSDDPEILMPKSESHLILTSYEKAVLIKWIKEGAEYKDHWAFIKPEVPIVPAAHSSSQIHNPIDNFILKKLANQGLEQNPEANKEILLRRVAFDLTGLPPSIEQMDKFLKDTSAQAYEKQVDLLLASSHYGEHMAIDWIDLSRYADTHGYSVDRFRDMSPWRDWVIKSLNNNMPYDQFVTWQLAGDLLHDPSEEMILATAFNRIHPQNMEGGIVEEEFLVEYAVDRASTFGTAFMGLTVACARCHDHKFDPISQKNFYELTSYFNNINEAGQISYNDAMPVPTILLSTEEEEQKTKYIESLIHQEIEKIEGIKSITVSKDFEQWFNTQQYSSLLNTMPTDDLKAHFSLDNGNLSNVLNPLQKGTMKREYTEGQKIETSKGRKEEGLLLDGDTWLDLKSAGVYGRDEAFSINLWVHIPETIKDGNIFHKGDGAALYAWRGYHLRIINDQIELMMAHTAPDNAIVEISNKKIPRNQWTNLSLTYDGSSKASGLRLYVDGQEWLTTVQTDNLYKDILFRTGHPEPGLQIGARLRGKGIGGSVIDEIKVYSKELSNLEIQLLAEDSSIQGLFSLKPDDFSITDKNLFEDYYFNTISRRADIEIRNLKKLRKEYVDHVESIKEVMVMKETEIPVQSYLLDRGLYDAPTEKVFPNTPEAILPMPKEFDQNRLGLAKWLFLPEHPLTARVAVNRYWQHFFGQGLVTTSEDFGNQGALPSHSELLDWLSMRFQDSNWDVKSINKLIVMSSTYRQSSIARRELMEIDKENGLYARGPAQRMTGEMLRDNALHASGLLNEKIGGKSVYPYQPKGLWKVNGVAYKPDEGDNLYRRSMYTIWKRSVPHPTLATFDAPDRSMCIARRQETNTPMQALVLLNDPTYIEAARVLGKQIADYNNVKTGIAQVFRKLTGRNITDDEMDLLSDLQEKEEKLFREDLQKTTGWLNTGEFRISKNEDKAIIAANAVVASAIINSDAAITKR